MWIFFFFEWQSARNSICRNFILNRSRKRTKYDGCWKLKSWRLSWAQSHFVLYGIHRTYIYSMHLIFSVFKPMTFTCGNLVTALICFLTPQANAITMVYFTWKWWQHKWIVFECNAEHTSIHVYVYNTLHYNYSVQLPWWSEEKEKRNMCSFYAASFFPQKWTIYQWVRKELQWVLFWNILVENTLYLCYHLCE